MILKTDRISKIIDINDLGKIGESQMLDYVIRDAVVETMVAKPLLFSEFTDANTNLLVLFATFRA